MQRDLVTPGLLVTTGLKERRKDVVAVHGLHLYLSLGGRPSRADANTPLYC